MNGRPSRPMSLREIRQALRRAGDDRDARILRWFFKTGPGEYGERDVFVGVRVPKIRALLRAAGDVPLATAQLLLRSRIHEERLFALLALVRAFQRGDQATRSRIYRLYLAATRYINNWASRSATSCALATNRARASGLRSARAVALPRRGGRRSIGP